MNFQKIIFLVLLLVVTISLSFIIGSLFNVNIFDINDFGFQFLIFSLLGSFVFFSTKYLRSVDTIIIVLIISSMFVFLMKKTNLIVQMGGLIQLFIYAVMLFTVYTLVFRLTWFRFKYIRNITFSILEAICYVLVHFILHLIIKREFKSQYILIYLLNGLKIMITLGVSFSIVEFVNSKLERVFFSPPERIVHEDDPEN